MQLLAIIWFNWVTKIPPYGCHELEIRDSNRFIQQAVDVFVLTWAPWRRLTSGASSGHVRNCSFWYWYLEMLCGRFLWFCLKCRRSPPPRAFRSFNHANQFFPSSSPGSRLPAPYGCLWWEHLEESFLLGAGEAETGPLQPSGRAPRHRESHQFSPFHLDFIYKLL